MKSYPRDGLHQVCQGAHGVVGKQEFERSTRLLAQRIESITISYDRKSTMLAVGLFSNETRVL